MQITKKFIETLDDNILKSIKWAAAEYEYVSQLLNAINKIDSENTENYYKEIKKIIKLIQYLSLAERRTYQFEQKVKRSLTKIYEDIGINLQTNRNCLKLGESFQGPKNLILQIRRIIYELDIENNKLVEYASRYEGSLKKEADELLILSQIDQIKNKKDIPEETHIKIVRLIKNIKFKVKDVTKWVKALESTLRRAKQIERWIIDVENDFSRDYVRLTLSKNAIKSFKEYKNDNLKKEAAERFLQIRKILKDEHDNSSLNLLKDLMKYASRYVKLIATYSIREEQIGKKYFGNPKSIIEEKTIIDRERRSAHNALITQIEILNRNIGKIHGWESMKGKIPIGGIISKSFFAKLRNSKDWKQEGVRYVITEWAWYLISGLFKL